MQCEELHAKLDAYMDGELSAEEARALEEHAANCTDCGRELKLARFVRDALGGLGEEVAVPLEAQAGWRNAVRAEAKRRRNRRWLHAVYAAAAALVLVVGATALLQSAPESEPAAPMTIASAPTGAVIARDGEMETMTLAAEEVYSARKKYDTRDLEVASASIEALIEEYDGSFSVERGTGEEQANAWAIYRIELPREYLEDFLNAVDHVGEEQDSQVMDTEGEIAIVYIQINEQQSE